MSISSKCAISSWRSVFGSPDVGRVCKDSPCHCRSSQLSRPRSRAKTRQATPLASTGLTSALCHHRSEGPNPARLRVIIIKEKRYKPIANPIVRCIPIMHINQARRVLRHQINNGYPVSRTQIKIPTTGNRYFHQINTSAETRLYGGEVITRQMLVPSHHSIPLHFVMPPKK